MMTLDFVKLSPTENMTLIVTSPVARAEHGRVAAALMDYASVYAEQTGFVEPATLRGAEKRLQMMGGEFCGNAAMCMAALTAREKGIEDGEVPVEISGADGLLTARVKSEDGAYSCEISMPLPTAVETRGRYPVVRLPGIAHVVVRCADPEALRPEAEVLLRDIAGGMPEEAVGLMLLSPEGRLLPLVYVKPTDTMVWERGCGSGSAAVGALMCRENRSDVELSLAEPGGIITVRAEWKNGISALSIGGKVRIVCEGKAYI